MLTPAAQRALASARRRQRIDAHAGRSCWRQINGREGLEPVRYTGFEVAEEWPKDFERPSNSALDLDSSIDNDGCVFQGLTFFERKAPRHPGQAARSRAGSGSRTLAVIVVLDLGFPGAPGHGAISILKTSTS